MVFSETIDEFESFVAGSEDGFGFCSSRLRKGDSVGDLQSVLAFGHSFKAIHSYTLISEATSVAITQRLIHKCEES